MMPFTKLSGQTAFVLKIVQVLREMNGIGKASAVKSAIAAEAAEAGEKLDETELSTGAVKWENDVHWARMHLVNAGALEPRATAGTGNWKLTAEGWRLPLTAETALQICGKKLTESVKKEEDDGQQDALANWETELKGILQKMTASGFERLCAEIMTKNRLEARTTGKSGDKGIDGEGFFPLDTFGLIGIQVAWQCKRYADHCNVGPGEIRDFRGSMHTQIDHGIFFTTSKFTTEAQHEAGMPGKRTVRLLDVASLVGLLKANKIGVNDDPLKGVSLNTSYFDQFLSDAVPVGQSALQL